jgi:hypothetical protein
VSEGKQMTLHMCCGLTLIAVLAEDVEEDQEEEEDQQEEEEERRRRLACPRERR